MRKPYFTQKYAYCYEGETYLPAINSAHTE